MIYTPVSSLKMDVKRNFLAKAYYSSFLRYAFVGATTFILDFFCLLLLHGRLQFPLLAATALSYWISITYNFFLNRYWAFSSDQKNGLRNHLLNYACLLGANFLLNLLVVATLSHVIFYGAAKAVAVVLQISWTYPIYKNVIFAPVTLKTL